MVGTIGCWLVLLVGTIGCWLVQVLEVQLLDCKVDPILEGHLLALQTAAIGQFTIYNFPKNYFNHLFSQQVLGVVLRRPVPTIICTIHWF